MLAGLNFMVSIDQRVVFNDISTPDVAFGITFTAYYVFGIKYPEDLPATFEFIQRLHIIDAFVTFMTHKLSFV